MARKLPFGRLCLWLALSVLVSCGVSYEACMLTGSTTAIPIALPITFGITVVPVMRWWLKAARAAGVPKTEFTPSRLRTAGTTLLAIAVSIVFEVASYDATQSYVLEALVALAGTAIVANITAKSIASMPNANAPSSDLMRFSAIGSALCVPIFGGNLWLQIAAHAHPYAFGPAFHSYIIAGFFLLVPLNAVNAYRYWRRWKASGTPGATPTFT